VPVHSVPTFGPIAQKGPQSSNPGPKGTPQRASKGQIKPTRNLKKDLERTTIKYQISNAKLINSILDTRIKY
jgi:hypothetical protein